MDEREAKDFLVQQAAEQAGIEGVPLSDLEKRMMYFTESGYVPEDPIQLNEEFEAQYDTEKYEEKVAKLFKNARKRISAESDAKSEIWDEAICALSTGDHYILLMCGGWPWFRSSSIHIISSDACLELVRADRSVSLCHCHGPWRGVVNQPSRFDKRYTELLHLLAVSGCLSHCCVSSRNVS